MPTYMDIHEIPGGITAEEVAKAHAHDVAVEGKYGVHYHRYWVNERRWQNLLPLRGTKCGSCDASPSRSARHGRGKNYSS